MATAATDEKPVDMIEVKWNGKTLQMTEADAQAVRQDVVNQLQPYVNTLSKSLKLNLKMHEKYVQTAELKGNFLKAVSQFVVMTVGNIRMPSDSLKSRASSAMSKLEAVMSEKKLIQLAAALAEAETAINAYRVDTERFLAELGGTAQVTGTVLTVSAAVGFAVLGAMGAGMLVVAGATTATAGALSAASVVTLQNTVNLVGKAALGQDVDVMKAVEKNAIDSAVALATGAIAGKIDASVFKSTADAAAKKVAGKLSYLSSQQAQTVLSNFLNGSGQAVLVSVASQCVEFAGDIAKKGQTPTKDDVLAQFEKLVIATLTAGIMKNLEFGEQRLLDKAAGVFEAKYVPDAVKRIVSGAMPSSSEMKKIAVDVFKALTESTGKAGATGIASGAKGDETAEQIAALGLAALDRDTAFKRLIDSEAKAALQKRKIAVK